MTRAADSEVICIIRPRERGRQKRSHHARPRLARVRPCAGPTHERGTGHADALASRSARNRCNRYRRNLRRGPTRNLPHPARNGRTARDVRVVCHSVAALARCQSRNGVGRLMLWYVAIIAVLNLGLGYLWART